MKDKDGIARAIEPAAFDRKSPFKQWIWPPRCRWTSLRARTSAKFAARPPYFAGIGMDACPNT
jgi:hypothetical protein